MKVFGIILVIFGFTDIIADQLGSDVWTDWLHIDLPELLWQFSGLIEIGAGFLFIKLADKRALAQPEATPESDLISEAEEALAESNNTLAALYEKHTLEALHLYADIKQIVGDYLKQEHVIKHLGEDNQFMQLLDTYFQCMIFKIAAFDRTISEEERYFITAFFGEEVTQEMVFNFLEEDPEKIDSIINDHTIITLLNSAHDGSAYIVLEKFGFIFSTFITLDNKCRYEDHPVYKHIFETMQPLVDDWPEEYNE
ncbi:MAG: hypothetical protein HOM11_10115 [Methylococcales bacterium]|jgi:hypothetical protein|nr:hypothetical protein [Methylococcales bacterium]